MSALRGQEDPCDPIVTLFRPSLALEIEFSLKGGRKPRPAESSDQFDVIAWGY